MLQRSRALQCLFAHHWAEFLSRIIDYPQELDLRELVLNPLQLSAGMLLLYCLQLVLLFDALSSVTVCNRKPSYLIEHSLTIIGCYLWTSLFVIPMQSQRPTKYFPRFSPLYSPEIGWNPTTSAHNFHLPSLTLIQWAVIPRNTLFVLSAVHPSLVVAIFPGAACNLGESQF